ncbi:MAG: hypothetical protein RI988_2024 [Pseudomonadota bacterium]|jgi:hypothetical protein
MGKCCGTCRLYSENLYRGSRVWKDARACCADVAHVMPESWSIDNYMEETKGTYCDLWEPFADPPPSTKADSDGGGA